MPKLMLLLCNDIFFWVCHVVPVSGSVCMLCICCNPCEYAFKVQILFKIFYLLFRFSIISFINDKKGLEKKE